MKTRDIFSYSFGAIRLRKLRAGLTTLGVVIGIAAIVALLSITQGLQNSISNQLQSGFATNTLYVSAGAGGGFSIGGGSTSTTDSEFVLVVNYTDVIDEIDGVTMSTAVIQKQVYINNTEGVELVVTITGVDFSEYANIYSATFVAETGEIPLDANPNNETIVIGKSVNEPWDNGTVFAGLDAEIGIIWTNSSAIPFQNETYTGHVTAVLKEIGGFGAGPSDSSIYIPISQAQSFFGTDECSSIVVQLENDDDATIDHVSDAIKEAFGDEVSVMSSTAVLNTISGVFSTVQLFLVGIAGISLLVAGIGIMNIMIVSLMERTKEIGILKALGMKSRSVLMIFLSESLIIGLIGAVIGIISGWLLANVASVVFSSGIFTGASVGQAATAGSFAMEIVPVLTPTVMLGALAFGVGVSVIFALYPAWRASKLNPVKALRYE